MCNCRNQSGLCYFCAEQELVAMEQAAAEARKLKVWLAVKRAPEFVRAEWKKQLTLAERRAA